MAGLHRPVLHHRMTQDFGSSPLNLEPRGWFVEKDAGGPLRAFPGTFPGGVSRPFVHAGIDIGVPIGRHVLAVEDGVIKDRAELPGGERYLLLRIRPGVLAFYTHLSDWRVHKDDEVKRGHVIALSGNTGKFTTGPHLHFEVRIKEHGRLMRYNPVRLFRGGDLADDPRIAPRRHKLAVEPEGSTSPQPPATPPAAAPDLEMPPLLDYLAGDTALLPAGAQIRSTPWASGDLVRTLATEEQPVVIGWVSGDDLAGSARWLMWGSGATYEFVHESQVSSVTEPDCDEDVVASTPDDLGEDPDVLGEDLDDDEPDAEADPATP